jgi:RNA polymerase sigma factor (sigma-70 family)
MENVSDLSDLVLVNRVKENACSDSFVELSNRHGNLFYKICQSYIKVLSIVGYHPDDIFEDRDVVIFEAIRKYDPNRGARFSTFLANVTRWFCLNKINKTKGVPENGSEEEMEAAFNDKSVENFENQKPEVDVDAIFRTLSQTKDGRILNLFKLRYDTSLDKKRPWIEIADQLKLSVQATMQLHKKGLKLLREEMASENLNVFREN